MPNIVDNIKCISCGECCKGFPLPLGWGNATGETINEDWNLENGWCKHLIDNGDKTYSCKIYDNRPKICREFPTGENEVMDFPSCEVFK